LYVVKADKNAKKEDGNTGSQSCRWK